MRISRVALAIAVSVAWLTHQPAGAGGPVTQSYWRVDDVRAGMRGEGLTVVKGTKIEKFSAEVLGVLKNTSPGRDMVLARLSGCDLEKTGVIAGMSGSPVYLGGKLLGAVAYAWQFGKEPIAGITPFCQMKQYAEAVDQREFVGADKVRQVGLRRPLSIHGREYDRVTVSDDFAAAEPTAADGLWLQPLRTPLTATGFTPASLSLLRERVHGTGLVPVQGGGVSGVVADEARDTTIQPGGALTVALVTGDFDLSGIGTVTAVEGQRVYGWGHPFLGIGGCDFPLMTGYVHTIYPRQNLSFKMGSPLRTVGVVNADVSTCIAGWLGREPDMLPVSMTVAREPGGEAKTFRVRVVRQPALLPNLVFTCLTNSVDMEGELPEELTADFKAVIRLEGREPIVIEDTFSGANLAGSRAPRVLYSPVAAILNTLVNNEHQPVRIEAIECSTSLRPGRVSAEIEGVEIASEVYAPGETVKAAVVLRPYKGSRQRVPVSLKLPDDLPEGAYTARVCDDMASTGRRIRENPTLNTPTDLEQTLALVRVQSHARRTHLVLELPLEDAGVALDGKALPDLPASMVHILANGRRSGAQTIATALVSRHPTDWVVTGSETLRFRVSRSKGARDSQ